MNRSHAKLTAWGLSQVQIGKNFTMLDVGCGGGRTIARLAKAAPDGRVFGVDYSEASVAAARRANKASIERGTVCVLPGSVSRLPFPEATFDLVTAVETHYYWPDLTADLREVLRVVKPGGQLVLIAETYKDLARHWMEAPAMMLLGATNLTPNEHEATLRAAGFTNVGIAIEPAHGWICATGTRPAGNNGLGA
jgi:ubiquinone/menaquinone biosynthesis C-methylase UbiE